jgi:hypothetical protein
MLPKLVSKFVGDGGHTKSIATPAIPAGRGDGTRRYSYRSASIGSSREAFTAG